MARPKLGDSETERLHVKITSSEIKAIDDWRFENRLPSRSEAVRRLIQIGLAFDEKADRLHAALKEMVEDLSPRAEEVMKVSELPSDEDPAWLAAHMVASGGLAQAAFEHIQTIGIIAQAMDARRHFMKQGDVDFKTAAVGSMAYEAKLLSEELQRRVDEFERSKLEDHE